jgi:hypothetical protein
VKPLSRIDQNGRLELRCCCGASACFGDGVKLHKGELGTWYCRKHVPPGFLPGTAMPGPPPSLPIQGRLL